MTDLAAAMRAARRILGDLPSIDSVAHSYPQDAQAIARALLEVAAREQQDNALASAQKPPHPVRLWRKKPRIVEAIQVSTMPAAMPGWWIDAAKSGDLLPIGGGSVGITTLEGRMRAKPGDWIVRGIKGELYPVRADIFAETYEAVEQPTGTPSDAGGWRDISTAPKDDWIMTYGPLHADGTGELPRWRVSFWDTECEQWYAPCSGSHAPTHWQPLPSPPSQTGRGEDGSSTRDEGVASLRAAPQVQNEAAKAGSGMNLPAQAVAAPTLKLHGGGSVTPFSTENPYKPPLNSPKDHFNDGRPLSALAIACMAKENPTQAALDAEADLWRAFDAGDLPAMKDAARRMGATLSAPSTGTEPAMSGSRNTSSADAKGE